MDIDGVVKLCRKHGLHNALLYVYNNGLAEYVTPAEILEQEVRISSGKAAAEVTKKGGTHAEAMAGLRASNAEKDARIASLKRELHTMLEHRKEAERNAAQHKATVDEWKGKAAEADTRCAAAETSVQQLTDSVATLETQLREVTAGQDELRRQGDARQQSEEALQATLAGETARAKKTADELGRIQLQFTDMAEQCRLAMAARDAGAHEVVQACAEKDKLADILELERSAAAAREQKLAEREKELLAAVRKLECAEEAVEGELTCMHCLSVFRSPTTVVMTGKTYCAQCVVPALKQAEDDDEEVDVDEEERRLREAKEGRVQVRRLETLSGKFGFMKQALQQLRGSFQ